MEDGTQSLSYQSFVNEQTSQVKFIYKEHNNFKQQNLSQSAV